MDSYSQLGEDIFCFQNFINVPRGDVVLLEVGTYDGKTYSNTLDLEKYHQCKCILVELSALNVRQIYKNRPDASVYNVAIMPQFGLSELLGDTPLSGIQSQGCSTLL
jgi:hypothetical protein